MDGKKDPNVDQKIKAKIEGYWQACDCGMRNRLGGCGGQANGKNEESLMTSGVLFIRLAYT